MTPHLRGLSHFRYNYSDEIYRVDRNGTKEKSYPGEGGR